MKMRTLIIRGSEWLRKNTRNSKSRYYTASLLFNGKMCCLGIMSRECGINESAMRNLGTPQELHACRISNDCVNEWLEEDDGGTMENNRNATNAMTINDRLLNDEMKIKQLKPIFKDQGWKIDWRPNE